MTRVFIIDTNVLVAGLVTGDSTAATAQVLDAMLDGRLPFLLSASLLEEYRAVLLRTKLRRLHGLSEVQVDSLLAEIVANAMWREPMADTVHRAPDVGDQHLWDLLADDAGAVLVTGDRRLLEQPRSGATIILPAACRQYLVA